MGKAGGWLDALGPAIGVVAGVTVVAGVYLLDPAVVDFGFALSAERTWPVGAFLIAMGCALAFKLAWPKGLESGSTFVDLLVNFTLGSISHYTYGLIACAIGAQALSLSPANYWAALLFVPGLLCLVVSFDNDTDDEVADADVEDEDEAAGERDDSSLGQKARAGLAMGGFFAVFMFSIMAWLGIAFWLYTQLKRIIIDGETAASLAPVFERTLDTLPFLMLLAVGLVLFLGAVFFLISLIPERSERAKPKAAPDLNPAEAAYVNASAEAVRAYAKAQGYDRNRWVVDAFGFVSVMGMILLGAVVMIVGGERFEASALRASLPLEVKQFGASWIVGFFAFIFAGGLPGFILSRLSARYAELAGWDAVSPKKGVAALTEALSAALRSRRLLAATPIDPGAFLRSAGGTVELYSLIVAAAIAGVALLLFYRELNSTDVLGEDAIDTTDYWTGTKTRYGYGDVAKVELRCFLTGENEPVEAYVLHFRDGREIDIYTKAYSVEAQIAAYEAIDAKLVALGVPFVPGSHQGWFKRDERGYDADCVETLAGEFSEELRPRIKKLFHVDEMSAVEDIWPWDDELGQAKRAGDAYEAEKAVALYTKAIASGRLPANLLAFAYFERAEARYDYSVAYGLRDGEVILALKDFQKAREIEPTERVYGREGSAYIALGAYDEAKAAFRKALELDQPKPHWPLIGLARVERIQGNYDAAMAHLDELLRVWGADSATMPIYFHRAWVLYLKSDYTGSADAITKGLAYQTDYGGAYRQRACAYARLGEFAKAKADIALAIKLLHDDPAAEAWKKTPYGKSTQSDYERDDTTIAVMESGSADEAARASLCSDSWNYGDRLRTRSPLLPAGG